MKISISKWRPEEYLGTPMFFRKQVSVWFCIYLHMPKGKRLSLQKIACSPLWQFFLPYCCQRVIIHHSTRRILNSIKIIFGAILNERINRNYLIFWGTDFFFFLFKFFSSFLLSFSDFAALFPYIFHSGVNKSPCLAARSGWLTNSAKTRITQRNRRGSSAPKVAVIVINGRLKEVNFVVRWTIV